MALTNKDSADFAQLTTKDDLRSISPGCTIKDDIPKELIDTPTRVVHQFLLGEEPEFSRVKDFRDRVCS